MLLFAVIHFAETKAFVAAPTHTPSSCAGRKYCSGDLATPQLIPATRLTKLESPTPHVARPYALRKRKASTLGRAGRALERRCSVLLSCDCRRTITAPLRTSTATSNCYNSDTPERQYIFAIDDLRHLRNTAYDIKVMTTRKTFP